jgi:hypothetical protein
MAKQYRLNYYDVTAGDGKEAYGLIDARVTDGWSVHTADVAWPGMSILWERDAPEDDGEVPPAAKSRAASGAKGRRSGGPSS